MSARLSFWLPRAELGLGLATGMTHAQARAYVVQAFLVNYGRPPTRDEAQFVQAIGLQETGYGGWWSGDCAGSFNMGSIQSGKTPCDPSTSCQHGDTHADGTPYQVCFRRYPNAQAGFNDLVKVVYVKRPEVLRAAQAGDWVEAVAAMRRSHYFEASLATYTSATKKSLSSIAAALQEPVMAPKPTIAPGLSAVDLGVAVLSGFAAVKLLARYRS